MTMKIVTAIAVAASVLVMSNAAEAGGKRNGIHASDSFHSVQHKRHHKRGGFKRHFYFDHYGYNPGHACRRLKRKAYYTGSRYWWKRYRHCMNRYYY